MPEQEEVRSDEPQSDYTEGPQAPKGDTVEGGDNGEPRPQNLEKICRRDIYEKAGKVVRVLAPADGGAPDFFAQARVIMNNERGQKVGQLDISKFIPGCKSVEEAFEKFDAVAKRALEDWKDAQQRPRLQIPHSVIPPEVFGRRGFQPPRGKPGRGGRRR